MSGHTKLGVALILVFVFFLLALAAELLYALWFRRRFAGAATGADDREIAATTVESELGVTPNSKELLLYLLCCKNQSRIEPTSAAVSPMYSVDAVAPGFPHPGSAATSTKPTPPSPPPTSSSEAEDAEMEKWRGLYASRVLFTIREEEKEGAESDGGSARLAVGRVHVSGERDADDRVEQAVLSDDQAVGAGQEVEDEEEHVLEDPAFHFTPFSTPCASPPFYTPSPSPPRGFEAGADMEAPPDADTSDNEVFSPAEVKLPAGTYPLKDEGKFPVLLPFVRPVRSSC